MFLMAGTRSRRGVWARFEGWGEGERGGREGGVGVGKRIVGKRRWGQGGRDEEVGKGKWGGVEGGVETKGEKGRLEGRFGYTMVVI